MSSFRPLVENLLAGVDLRIERINKSLDRHQEKLGQLILADQFKRAGENFFFIQIGACDGVSFDALYDFVLAKRLRGIAIEPLPDLFQELKQNYAGCPSVLPLNVGIHRTAKEMTMYRILSSTNGLPDYVKGMASMDPDHHKLYGIPTEHVRTEVVRCISWDTLLAEQQIRRIDLLQLDTEGYDYEILDMLNFERLRPAVIKFEHDLRLRPKDRSRFVEAIGRLLENDYHILTMPLDAIAYSHLSFDPNAVMH